MSSAQLLPNIYQKFKLANGSPNANGRLYSYLAGSAQGTPQFTYTDEGAGSTNANPVVLDGNGIASVWLRTDLSYELVLKDSGGNTIWDVDNISAINSTSIDKTKLASNLAGVALTQDPNNALALQVDNVTTQINGSNQLVAKAGGITADTFPSSSKMDFTLTGNLRDQTCPGFNQLVPQLDWTSPTLLSNPLTIPGDIANCAKWSPNGEFLAVGSLAAPHILIYQRSGTTLTKLANPATLPGFNVAALAWSGCGEFLAVSKSTTPFIIVYQRTGNSFTALGGMSALGAGQPTQGFAFSPNSDFLGYSLNHNFGNPIGHYIGTFMLERSGTTFTDITSSGGFPSQSPGNVPMINAWSPDSALFATISLSTGGINVYSRLDAGFTSISGPSTSSYNTNIKDFAFSPDGNYFAIAVSVSPYVLIFKMSGHAFASQLSDPSILPTGAARCVAWSPNSQYLLIGHSNSPYMSIYSVSGTTATKISDPVSLPAGPINGAAWNWTKQFLAVAGDSSPFIQVYQTASTFSTTALSWSRSAPNVS